MVKKRVFLLIFFLSIIILNSCSIIFKSDKYLSFFYGKIKDHQFLKDLPKKDIVTRADVAYLFGIYFPEEVSVSIEEIPFDIKMYPQKEILYAQVKREIFPSFPDKTFRPEKPVLKYQLAILINNFLLNRYDLYNYYKTGSFIKDVDETFFAFKPIFNVVFLGLMETKEGNFKPFDSLTGYELIKIFYRLNNL